MKKDATGLTVMADEVLQDKRKGKNKQHTITALMRQATYGRLAGYEDTNDGERLRVDSEMIIFERTPDRRENPNHVR